MKKLLLILLCLPMIFSCGDSEKNTESENKKEDTIVKNETEIGLGQNEKKENKDEGSLDREVTKEMRDDGDGYTGKGTWTYFNGAKYVGEWKDGDYHGQGTITIGYGGGGYGGKYLGEWNGDKYVGEFKDGNLHGQGTYTFGRYPENRDANGDKYVGEWKDDKMHGKGTYTYPDGRVLKGLWENGEFLGE